MGEYLKGETISLSKIAKSDAIREEERCWFKPCDAENHRKKMYVNKGAKYTLLLKGKEGIIMGLSKSLSIQHLQEYPPWQWSP